MSAIRSLAAERPILFVLALFVVESILAFPFVAAFKLLGFSLVPLRLIIPVAQSFLMVWVVWHLGWFARSGFTDRIRDLHLFWYPTVLAFVPVLTYGSVEIPAAWLLFYALALLFTGLSEETFARGIMLPALLSKGKWKALFFAATIFSAGHFTNLFFESFGVLEWIDKFLTTFGFAVLYGAIFLRTGNIWPLIGLHAIHDFSYLISGTAGPFVAQPISIALHVSLSLLNIAYGIYILSGATVSRATEPAPAGKSALQA